MSAFLKLRRQRVLGLYTEMQSHSVGSGGGPYLERMRPRAQGRAYKIMKPTFHLTVKLEERA